MAYCNQDDILAEISMQDLIPFLDDDDSGVLNTQLLNKIIDRESAKIDGRISNIYTVPLVPTPPACRDACTIFTCEALYRRRLTPDEKNPFHMEAEELRERFKLIGNGKLELDLNFPRNYPQGAVVSAPIAINQNTR